MSDLISYWAKYSKKLAQKIENPRHVGSFTEENAKERQMRFALGTAKLDLYIVHLYWLVDESDGVIADAKFQIYGPSSLIGAAEAACELLIRKNYDQARRLTADLIDKQVRDRNEDNAFPQQSYPYLNLIIDAIDEAAQQCTDIKCADAYVPTPLESLPEGNGYPGWNELRKEQKLTLIEEVIASDIRPYIELDAGGIQIVSFSDAGELTIAYEGACTSCYSSIGSTLSAIQNILRSKLDKNLVVIPDMQRLNF